MRAFLVLVAVSAICLPLSPLTTLQEKQTKAFLELGMSTLQNGARQKKSQLVPCFEPGRFTSRKVGSRRPARSLRKRRCYRRKTPAGVASARICRVA